MSYVLSNAVRYLEHPEMKGATKAIFRNYLDHASDDGTNIFPSIETVARETGFDKKTVKKSLKILKEHFLEIYESVNLGSRVGRINKYKLKNDSFINFLVDEEEKQNIVSCLNNLDKKTFARPKNGLSDEFAQPIFSFARPKNGPRINHNNKITNTNDDNTNHLGSTKYFEKVTSLKPNVVVPIEYICFDKLPKSNMEPSSQNIPLEEKIETETFRKVLEEKPKTKPSSQKSEVQRTEIPLAIIQAMNNAGLEDGLKNNRKWVLRWAEAYGEDYVVEKINLTKLEMKKRVVPSPMGWLKCAVDGDWKENSKSTNRKSQETAANPFCKVVDELPKPKVVKQCAREWWENILTEDEREYLISKWNEFNPVLEVRLGYHVLRDYYHSEEFYYSSQFESICWPFNKKPPEKVIEELSKPKPSGEKRCAREWWENEATDEQKTWSISVFNNHDPVLLERFAYEKMKDYYHSEEFYYEYEFESICSNFRISKDFRYPKREAA